MATSATKVRNPVRRLQSRNRQKEYITPSERDVLCPSFDGTFVKVGKAALTNDYQGLCHDSDGKLACDYKDKISNEVTLCKRYWNEDPFNMKFLRAEPEISPTTWQELDVQFNYERPFVNRTATVEYTLMREVETDVDLGDFLNEWEQWDESDEGKWVQQTNNGQKEILNTINQSGRSFWYNPDHMELKDYTHSYFVQARAGDDDTYGSSFRYHPSEKSFYTFEWDSGGMNVKGMAIYRNTYTGNKIIKTRLAYSSVEWGDGKKYIHHVSISVFRNRVRATVRRLTGTVYTHIASFDFVDTSVDAPLKGAWGPLTQSQPNTYFWDLNYKANVTLDSSLEPLLTQEIPLSFKKKDGSYHLVSEPMSSYFSDELRDQAALKNGVNPEEITSTEYYIMKTNVYEGVQFSIYDIANSISTSKNTRIAMTSFDYDGSVSPFKANRTVTDRENPLIIEDKAQKDKSLTGVIVKANHKRLFDTFSIMVNGITIRYVPNVMSNELVVELPEWINLDKGDTVTVRYIPNSFEMEFYLGQYVDTHDKIFKIEGSVLGWHHIPSYETERGTDGNN